MDVETADEAHGEGVGENLNAGTKVRNIITGETGKIITPHEECAEVDWEGHGPVRRVWLWEEIEATETEM